MRLRRKPWIDEAIKEYDSFVHLNHAEEHRGHWRDLFDNPDAPLWVELGTGKVILFLRWRSCILKYPLLASKYKWVFCIMRQKMCRRRRVECAACTI